MSDEHGTWTLLVRRADPAHVDAVRPVLGRLEPAALHTLAAAGGLIVMGDAALPPAAPPLAAMAMALDRADGSAELVAAGVVSPLRRRGLGSRLFDGTAMLLRSEGFQTVQATIEPGSAGAMWLAGLGFAADDGGTANRLVYWL